MQFKKQLRRRYQQGLTLIEASMVLALSAVVIAGVMLYYASAQENNKFMQAQSELASLQTIVQSIYAGRTGYDGIDISIAKGSSAIPPNLLDSNGLPTTPWNTTFAQTSWGQVALGTCSTMPSTNHRNACEPVGHAATGASLYYVSFAGVPVAQCTPLLSQSIGGLQAVQVDSFPNNAWNYVPVINGLIQVKTIGDQCATAGAAGNGFVDLGWVIGTPP